MRPIVMPSTMLRITIMRVALISSSRVGQVTFRISSRTPTRNWRLRSTQPVSRLDGCATCTRSMLLRLFVHPMRVAAGAVLAPLHPLRVLPLVLVGEEVAAFALGAFERDLVSWHSSVLKKDGEDGDDGEDGEGQRGCFPSPSSPS